MGLAVTLAHMGKIGPGDHRIDTPTGVVTVTLSDGGVVTVRNVPSYRSRPMADLYVEGHGWVFGDIAWGGNWFFLTEPPDGLTIEQSRIEELTEFCWALRQELAADGITGDDEAEIDHIEVFGPPSDTSLADSKNFVLCPGKAYDRSPCGTGTSAKLACLHEDGELEPGQIWRQAGILDSVFEGQIEIDSESDDRVVPIVTGSAFVTAESELLIDPEAPFAFGIPSEIS